MTESTVRERIIHRWYHGPCSSCPTSRLPSVFTSTSWGSKNNGMKPTARGESARSTACGCEIILCEDASRRDKGRLFVELTPEGLDELRRTISEHSVPTQKAWWGYDVIRIADPDGNELFVPTEFPGVTQ